MPITFPFAYEAIPPTTWAYMSSLFMIALFFKFNRFWSVRNFDLLLIVLLAPGLLMIEGGRHWQKTNLDSVGSEKFQASPSETGSQASAFLPALPANGESEADRAGTTSTSTLADGLTDRHSDKNGLNDENQSSGEDTKANPLGDTKRGGFESPTFFDQRQGTQSTPKELSAEPSTNQLTASVISSGQRLQRWGFLWLFMVELLLLIRLLLDPNLARKPLLDPNLSGSGLVFLGCSLMIFLFANMAFSEPAAQDLHGARNALKMLQRQAADQDDVDSLRREGPGYWLFNLFPVISTFNSGNELLETDPNESAQLSRYVLAAKMLAIASQVAIVICLVLFCHFNYNNFNVGVGVAVIYLMLPYTSIFTGYTLHALPAALLLMALLFFRTPVLAGILLGLATGVTYYPIFLIPLWCSFYWERGVRSFLWGLLGALVVCVLGLVFTSPDVEFFIYQLRAMFGFLLPRTEGLEGIWALGWSSWYRLPLLVAHISLAVSYVFWPAEKNIGTLVAYTGAIMLAVQFWLGFDGGLTMAWFLPFGLLTFFRPNLAGRVAKTELNRTKRTAEGSSELLV